MLSSIRGPYRTPTFTKPEVTHTTGIAALFLVSLLVTCGVNKAIEQQKADRPTIQQQRHNASIEAARASQLIYGHRALSVYCYEAVSSNDDLYACNDVYDGKALRCLISVDEHLTVQRCCDSAPQSQNRGCVGR